MYSKSNSAMPLSYNNTVNYNNNGIQNSSTNGDFTFASSQSNNSFLNDNSNAEADLPDLSHLSEEERKIIEAVVERQRAEEKASPIPNKCNTLPLR